jgi:methionyl-tRNA synthetase
MQGFAFHRALESIWTVLDAGNRYIDVAKPWELAKRDPAALRRVLGHAAEALRMVTLFLYPFMPTTGERMWGRLGLPGSPAAARLAEVGRWGQAGARTAQAGEALFPRVETEPAAAMPGAQAAPAPAAPGQARAAAPQAGPAEVSIDDFRRLDLRVAEIREAVAVPGSKKLVRLTVAVGLETRTIVAGILQDYPPETLVGKQIVVVANLQPTTLMGVESRGMLLAATDAEGKLVLVAPERRAAVGVKVK